MKRNAFNNKRDPNEKDIVAALQSMGASVIRLDQFDLLVGYKGLDTKMEVKNPAVDWSLTASQRRFIHAWQGSELYIVTSAEQAVQIILRRSA